MFYLKLPEKDLVIEAGGYRSLTTADHVQKVFQDTAMKGVWLREIHQDLDHPLCSPPGLRQ